jgi:predicted nuclease of restriction endonuclease-like RecB superfamily
MRGLAHIIKSGFCTFEVVSPLEPDVLRRRIFASAAAHVANPAQTERVIEKLADELTRELGRTVLRADIKKGLYADLSENKLLTAFDEPAPESVIHRYNLAQVQGVFYRASRVVINAYRNDPGEYKLLFRYLKLFRLMAYVEGDADHGFTLTIDGPVSLFRPSTRYGLDLAKLIPALLHVTKWNLVADLELRDTYNNAVVNKRFTLDSESELVSHYPPGKEFDSMVRGIFRRLLGARENSLAIRARSRTRAASRQRDDSRLSPHARRRKIILAGNRRLLASRILTQEILAGATRGER